MPCCVLTVKFGVIALILSAKAWIAFASEPCSAISLPVHVKVVFGEPLSSLITLDKAF